MNISDKKISEYFQSLKVFLLNKENINKYTGIRNQCIDSNAGVYCFFINNELKYIGESGCLKKRINDLLNTKNHSFRRSFGEVSFQDNKLYTKASSQKGYHADIEVLLNNKMKTEFSFSYKAMNIGRKEFEEWLQEDLLEVKFLNKRKKRK